MSETNPIRRLSRFLNALKEKFAHCRVALGLPNAIEPTFAGLSLEDM